MTGFLRRADGFLRREDGFLRKQSAAPSAPVDVSESVTASFFALLDVPPPEHDFQLYESVTASTDFFAGEAPEPRQLFWQPDPSDLGSAPSNFFVPYGGAELEVKQDGDGEYYLEISGTVSGTERSPILINSINGVDLSSVLDVEMWSNIKTVEDDSGGGGTDHRHMFRYSGSTIESTACYYHGWQSTFNRVRVSYWINNSGTNLESLGNNLMGPGAHVFLRSRIDGETLTTKNWVAPEEEPEDWVIEVTDSTISEPGGLGFWRENGPFPQRIYGIGIGINGAEAPSEPIDGPTAREVAFSESVTASDSMGHVPVLGVSWTETAYLSSELSTLAVLDVSLSETITVTQSVLLDDSAPVRELEFTESLIGDFGAIIAKVAELGFSESLSVDFRAEIEPPPVVVDMTFSESVDASVTLRMGVDSYVIRTMMQPVDIRSRIEM